MPISCSRPLKNCLRHSTRRYETEPFIPPACAKSRAGRQIQTLACIVPSRYECHCIGCPYQNAAHLPVHARQIRSSPLSMEDNGASVLLIFQAPGVDEWAQGKPVVSTNPSSAGVRLEVAFQIALRTRRDYNITNTVQCFPGKRPQVGTVKPRDNAPPAAVRRHCSEWLRQDIEAHAYKRIIVFGAHARRAIRALGLEDNPRFHFIRHPTGGISNESLAKALG